MVIGPVACPASLEQDAAKEKKMVVLKNYESSHSGDIRDRKVEPFAFTTNYLDVWCYDPEEAKEKKTNAMMIALKLSICAIIMSRI